MNDETTELLNYVHLCERLVPRIVDTENDERYVINMNDERGHLQNA